MSLMYVLFKGKVRDEISYKTWSYIRDERVVQIMSSSVAWLVNQRSVVNRMYSRLGIDQKFIISKLGSC